jgi:hypothetical protein
MHPLEDFAEVFGHFLHIADTLQTAAELGLLPQPDHSGPGATAARELAEKPRIGLLEIPMAQLIAETWLPLTKGLNQINRSMGKPDLYPFVLGAPVIAKLTFVADLVSVSRPIRTLRASANRAPENRRSD